MGRQVGWSVGVERRDGRAVADSVARALHYPHLPLWTTRA